MQFHTLYNPHNIPKKILIENFVIRRAEFNNIYDHIKYYTKRSDIKSIHYLIQGQRGAGKSTLLLRLKYECETNPKLLPVIFNEEELAVYDTKSFFTRIYEIIDEFDIHISSIEELLFYITTKNITLVLLIDNFLEMLDSFISKEEVKIFIELIQSNKNIKIVGAITLKNDLYYQFKNYFEVSFEEIHLEGLHYMQSIDYLRYLSYFYNTKNIKNLIENNPKKIKILRDLTDGNPRIIAMLIDVMANDSTIIEDVEKLLDIVTEHYRHRTKELNHTQRLLLFEIAQHFNPISYQKLINLPITQNILDFELNKLTHNYILEKIQTKNGDFFKIKERFFNIWFLMRYKKQNSDSIKWLIEFLDIWYDNDQLKAEITSHTKLIKKEKIQDIDIPKTVKFTESLNQVYIKRFGEDNLSDEHYILTIDFLLKKNKLKTGDNILEILSMGKSDYYFKKALKEYQNKKYKKSVEHLQNALDIDAENFIFYMMLSSNYKNMGYKYETLNIKTCKKAIENFSEKDKKIPMLNALYIEAIYSYILYNYTNKDFYTLNSIKYYTNINFTNFDKSHRNRYLENIKIFLMSKNIKLSSVLIKNFLKVFETNTKVETIFNIIYMQGFYDELLDIFENLPILQERYTAIFYATLKALDDDNYITIPNEIESVVENYVEHFSLHKKEILKMVRINIIESHL